MCRCCRHSRNRWLCWGFTHIWAPESADGSCCTALHGQHRTPPVRIRSSSSVLVGLWVLWFVVMRRLWRALAAISATTVLALLPLVPVIYRYVTVHANHGFERSEFESQVFSADLLSVLCAPGNLTFWNWLRIGCYPRSAPSEMELYPGAAVLVLCGIGVWRALGGARAVHGLPSWLTVVQRLLVVVAILSAASVAIDLGFLRASSSSIRKPLLIGLVATALAMLLSRRLIACLRSTSTTHFYLLAALAMWLLALGPTIKFMGVPTGIEGPFALLRELPGVAGVRVPARFWSLASLSLAVVAGLTFATMVRGRSRAFIGVSVGLTVLVMAADGWLDRIVAAPAPPGVPDATRLAGRRVLELPLDGFWQDIVATYHAAEGNWVTVNGYSGMYRATTTRSWMRARRKTRTC